MFYKSGFKHRKQLHKEDKTTFLKNQKLAILTKKNGKHTCCMLPVSIL